MKINEADTSAFILSQYTLCRYYATPHTFFSALIHMLIILKLDEVIGSKYFMVEGFVQESLEWNAQI